MAISGVEMMLRSLGLGDVIKMAQDMQQKRTLEKIMAFADSMDEMRETIARMKVFLDERDNASGPGSEVRRLPPGNYNGLSGSQSAD